MLRTCAVRLDAIWLTESVRSFHTPDTPFTLAWPPRRPAVPTSSATRVTSELNSPICSSMRLTMCAARRNSPCSGRPSVSSGTVLLRSPLATAAMASVMASIGRARSRTSPLTEASMSAHCPCRLAGCTRCRVRPSPPTFCATRARSLARRRLWLTISLKVSASLPGMPSQCIGRCTEKSPSLTAVIAASRCCKGSSSGNSGLGAAARRTRRTGWVVDTRTSTDAHSPWAEARNRTFRKVDAA